MASTSLSREERRRQLAAFYGESPVASPATTPAKKNAARSKPSASVDSPNFSAQLYTDKLTGEEDLRGLATAASEMASE